MEFNFTQMLEEMKADNEGGRKSYFNPKTAGTYRIRFLPPLQGEKLFYNKKAMHWISQKGVACLNQEIVDSNNNLHSPEKCFACDFSRKLYNVGENSPERNLGFQIRRQYRYTFRIIQRENNEKEPLFFESGKTIFDLVYSILINPDWGNILSPTKGRDFNLVKTGSGMLSKYDKSNPVPNITPIYPSKDDILKLLMEDAPKLVYSSTIDFILPKEMEELVKNHINSSSNPLDDLKRGQENPPITQTPVPVAPPVNTNTNEEQSEEKLEELLGQFE